jgi:hypothetical protein
MYLQVELQYLKNLNTEEIKYPQEIKYLLGKRFCID